MRHLVVPFVLAAMLLSPCAARAGASLLVDDAGTVPDGRCQLESWLRLRGGGEVTAVPACGRAGWSTAWAAAPAPGRRRGRG